MRTIVGSAVYVHEHPWLPASRIFTPTKATEDPRLFDGHHLRPEVRSFVLEEIGRDWDGPYHDWPEWATAYLAGGEASRWWGSHAAHGEGAGEADDFDVLIGVDFESLKDAHLEFDGMTPEQIAPVLTQYFRDGLDKRNERVWLLVECQSWHLDEGSQKTTSPSLPGDTTRRGSHQPSSLPSTERTLRPSEMPLNGQEYPSGDPEADTSSPMTRSMHSQCGTKPANPSSRWLSSWTSRQIPSPIDSGVGAISCADRRKTTHAAAVADQTRSRVSVAHAFSGEAALTISGPITGSALKSTTASSNSSMEGAPSVVGRLGRSSTSRSTMIDDAALTGTGLAGSAFVDSSAHGATWASVTSESTASLLLSTTSPPTQPAPPGYEWVGPFGVTSYVNAGARNLVDIKPYAAYDISHGRWAVHPHETPADWSAASLPEWTWDALEGLLAYIDAIREMPEPLRTREGAHLFDDLHSDRTEAFGEHGEGVFDPANVLWKSLDLHPSQPLEFLVGCKRRLAGSAIVELHSKEDPLSQPTAAVRHVRREDSPEPAGMMVAIVPPRSVVQDLVVEGGETPQNIHLTLAYLGKTTEYRQQHLEDLVEVVRAWAELQHPLTCRTQGAGTFVNDGSHVLLALVDVPGLHRVHASLVDFLRVHGYRPREEHSFVPHVTLSYEKHHVRFLPKIVPTDWIATEVWVVVGGRWESVPLGRG